MFPAEQACVSYDRGQGSFITIIHVVDYNKLIYHWKQKGLIHLAVMNITKTFLYTLIS